MTARCAAFGANAPNGAGEESLAGVKFFSFDVAKDEKMHSRVHARLQRTLVARMERSVIPGRVSRVSLRSTRATTSRRFLRLRLAPAQEAAEQAALAAA